MWFGTEDLRPRMLNLFLAIFVQDIVGLRFVENLALWPEGAVLPRGG